MSGAIFLTLKISVARACILLWRIETDLSFFNRSWNEDDLSPYVIYNALSCKGFTLLLIPLLWNIQAKLQSPNWDVTNAFITVFLFLRHMDGATLANALSFCFFCWGCLRDLQKSFESKSITSSSFLLSDMMVLSSLLAFTCHFLKIVHDFFHYLFSCS